MGETDTDKPAEEQTPEPELRHPGIEPSQQRPLSEPSSSRARRFRESGLMQVAIRSPTPARPEKVSGLAPAATPSRVISARPRVTMPALALSPNPSPSTMPAASATTFLSAPHSSTPITSALV